ncbi:MAG TPA: type 1 glutamine amidotransferase [Methylophilaceae bacterium]
MKPVIIFRHALTEGAGYLGSLLTEKNIPWHMVRIDQGDALPKSAHESSGMVMMGGPMSVNDDLPWIPPLLALIREAIAADIPVLGHCLGGQLISKALGAAVSKNPVKEIGWGEIKVSQNSEATQWFADIKSFQGFHWHGETFSLPHDATHLLASDYCQNQAYSLGKHIAFQCHIEMTVEMVKTWCKVGQDELAEAAASPGVQSVPEILEDLQPRVQELNAIAKPVYERWIKGLKV